jgi:AAA+ ATPase superfamily predicted ATPase
VIVEQELREPRVYFAILERLATGSKAINEIAQPLDMPSSAVAKYLATLLDLKLVSRNDPFGAAPASRSGQWQLDDDFLRFWFRFVFPFQADLEAGLPPEQLFDSEIGPELADHVAPVFETWLLEWLRTNRGELATKWGNWWGNSTNEFRQRKERTTEEIDAVGLQRGRVTVIAEAKWTNRPLTPAIINDLDTYKIPALRQSGLRVVHEPRLIVACRGGYSDSLIRLAATSHRIELVDVASELTAQRTLH